MKIILLQDVAKIGKRGTIVDVSDGFALNQLIPKRLAEPATTSNLKKLAEKKAVVVAAKSADSARFQSAVTALTSSPLAIQAEVNDRGHLFKAISAKDIVAAAQEKGAQLRVEEVMIEAPIKEVGAHQVTLALHDMHTLLTIEVVKKT
ncbi:MAG: 50S ribosomal protein L9 [Patescibacteria group bacterium]